MRLHMLIAICFAALAACDEPELGEGRMDPDTPETDIAAAAPEPAPAAPAELPPLNPPAPGEPGGLPDDRTPLDESPFTAESAQGAGQAAQTYWIYVERGDFAQAYDLWAGGGEASGMSADDFAASFDKYSEIHANIGAPGAVEGAAGSLYVEIPVQVYGRMADDGAEFNMLGQMTLRRVNDVPGATPDQLEWRIAASDLNPRP